MIHAEPVDRRNMQADACPAASAPALLVNAKAERFKDEGRDSWDKLLELVGYEIWRPEAEGVK
jgi:hypothetical protein